MMRRGIFFISEWDHECRNDYSGACISSDKVCDGKVDCHADGDGKDEQNCEELESFSNL